jgi:hypothetical protein
MIGSSGHRPAGTDALQTPMRRPHGQRRPGGKLPCRTIPPGEAPFATATQADADEQATPAMDATEDGTRGCNRAPAS